MSTVVFFPDFLVTSFLEGFLIDFKGKDSEINIQTKKPEFKKWKWTSSKKMMELVVPFKKKLYASVVSEMLEELNKNN